MPIFRIASKLVYFAHVPKCGGSSINAYLTERFGPPAFIDRRFMRERERLAAEGWYRSSPQHIPAEWLDRLFPQGFFDAMFATVRHPVDRALSIFNYQLDVEKTVSSPIEFSQWLAGIEAEGPGIPFAMDNHIAPMSRIVPAGARVFRIEDGTQPVIDWIDSLAGPDHRARSIPVLNTRGGRKQKDDANAGTAAVTEDDIARIRRIYSEDFARFQYQ